MDNCTKRGLHLTKTQEENKVLGASKLPVYRTFGKGKSEQLKVIAGIYQQPQLKAPYDSSIVNDILTRSKRYKNLQPKVAFAMLDRFQRYGHLKKLAFSRLESTWKNQFAVFFKILDYKETETKPNDEFSHGIFSWTWNDFLRRRQLKSFVWVDILLRTHENTLHFYKFQKDLDALQLFMELVCDCLFPNIEEDNADIYQNIEKSIDAAKKALHTINNVEDDFYNNCEELKKLQYKEYFSINAKRSSEDKLIKKYLENRIWNSHIWDPIEIRYQISWLKNIVKQNQYHSKGMVDIYETDIDHWKQMLDTEKFIDANSMDYCYSSIEIYKNRLNEIQNEFDKEFDQMENKLMNIKLQTDKIREQHKWLLDEIEHFHEEEEHIHRRIEIEKETDQLKQQMNSEQVAKNRNKKTTKKKKAKTI